jgi:organic hydroperoxide reductase OsmC/OhrA
MSEYHAEIEWQLDPSENFASGKYSRGHNWHFAGGATVPATASGHIVPPPWSVETNVDPEEAFVASLSSGHMLWFLHLAREGGYVVESYVDKAVGIMAKNEDGKLAMTVVTLRPAVSFAPEAPADAAQLEALHHTAHEECFIANSVKTEVRVEI